MAFILPIPATSFNFRLSVKHTVVCFKAWRMYLCLNCYLLFHCKTAPQNLLLKPWGKRKLVSQGSFAFKSLSLHVSLRFYVFAFTHCMRQLLWAFKLKQARFAVERHDFFRLNSNPRTCKYHLFFFCGHGGILYNFCYCSFNVVSV